MKREQRVVVSWGGAWRERGVFKISSRAKIKPKDDGICRIEESLSVPEWSQSLNQPDSTQQRPCLPSYAISPAPNSQFHSVCAGDI